MANELDLSQYCPGYATWREAILYSKHPILGALMNKAARQVANVFSGWVIILTNSHVKHAQWCVLIAKCS